MKLLIYTLYLITTLFTLFEGSKFVDTIIKEKLSSFPVEQKRLIKKKDSPVRKANESFTSYISLTPLFKSSETTGPESNPEVKNNQLPDSPILRRYQLTGIIYLGKNKSIALIKKKGERESKAYHVNDTLDTAIITKITRDKVYLNYMNNTVILPMYYRPTNSRGLAYKLTERSNNNYSEEYSSAKRIRKILSRSDVENKVFKKVNQILTQIAISPYMKNGKMEGLRLVRVPKNNIVYELGGRSGDIIKRVNGHELSQIDQLYKLWENIKDDSIISVDLERNHQIYTYTFEIRE